MISTFPFLMLEIRLLILKQTDSQEVSTLFDKVFKLHVEMFRQDHLSFFWLSGALLYAGAV